jgi:hypothetical protein
MPAISITPGLTLHHELRSVREELYKSPVVSTLVKSGKWFLPGLFDDLSELVSAGGAVAKLLELQEKVTRVATGQESPDSRVASEITDLVLRDLMEGGQGIAADGLPPGIIVDQNSSAGTITVRLDVGQL